MNILEVDGVAVKNPQTLQWQIQDLDSEEGSGRNQFGDMMREPVNVKVKLVCTFPPMNDKEISILLNAVKPTFFQLTYPDAERGSRRTMTAYVGDRTAPIFIHDKATNQWIWQGLSMNFIEK